MVSTEQGDLYIFENLEFRCALATETPAAPAADGAAICTLAAFSKGFVAGGANGVLKVFERSDDPREYFKCLKVSFLFLSLKPRHAMSCHVTSSQGMTCQVKYSFGSTVRS